MDEEAWEWEDFHPMSLPWGRVRKADCRYVSAVNKLLDSFNAATPKTISLQRAPALFSCCDLAVKIHWGCRGIKLKTACEIFACHIWL
jgi:hypothetical protein